MYGPRRECCRNRGGRYSLLYCDPGYVRPYELPCWASSVPLERREVGKVRFRIDGVLHSVYEMPLAIIVAVTARIKILGRLNVAEKRKPQDGRLKTRTPKGL